MFINYYFNNYLDRLPINYILDDGSKYRSIFGTDSYARGVLHQNYDVPWTLDKHIAEKFNIRVENTHTLTHLPDDYAEYIYRFHLALVNKLQYP